jgi:hypothetical protein
MKKQYIVENIILFSPFIILFVIFLIFIDPSSIIKDWQIQHSVMIVEGAEHIFDSTRQVSGNYQQKNLYYWSSAQLLEIRQFYEEFTITPFVEVNSNNTSWLIAALKGSDVIKNPIRPMYIHTDFCYYRNVLSCISIALFDVGQPLLSDSLRSTYSTPLDEIQRIPGSGTLIIFSYNIPDPG